MEEAEGTVKHIVVLKFKDDVTPDKIQELMKSYVNLVNITSMKSFQWYLFLSNPFYVFVFSISTTHIDQYLYMLLLHPS